MDVQLVESTRVRRVFRVADAGDEFVLEYDGSGVGYESVRVKGVTVARVSGAVRITPRIDFRIGDHEAVIRIGMSWWASINPFAKLRSFSLEVDGQILYSDGPPIVKDAEPQHYEPCPQCGTSGAMQVGFTWWGGFVGASLLTHVECPKCGTRYNGRTGKSNAWPIAIYNIIAAILGIIAAILIIYWLLPNLLGP